MFVLFEGILKNLKPALKSTQDSDGSDWPRFWSLNVACAGCLGGTGRASFSEQKPSACESRGATKSRMPCNKIHSSPWGWLPDYPETNIYSLWKWMVGIRSFLFGMACFQERTVGFREGKHFDSFRDPSSSKASIYSERLHSGVVVQVDPASISHSWRKQIKAILFSVSLSSMIWKCTTCFRWVSFFDTDWIPGACFGRISRLFRGLSRLV